MLALILFSTVAVYNAETCEGNNVTLSCPDDKVIHVMEAMFGRTENVTCGGHPLYSEPCTNINATQNIKLLCNNRKNCSAYAVSEMFGQDPCPGINKYMKVSYTCAGNKTLTLSMHL